MNAGNSNIGQNMREFIRKNISVINLTIWILVISYYFIIRQESNKGLMFDSPQQKSTVIEHSFNSPDLHTPTSESIKLFVPRTEIDAKLESLEKKTDLIIKMIKNNQ